MLARLLVFVSALASSVNPVALQAGDQAGEEQPPLPESLVVPPAPARSPEEEQVTLETVPGVRIELAACEPLVADPVAIAFDADGRMWVAEMRGFMPDAEGTGEDRPIGRVAVLDDEDGDGRYDTRQEFLEGLVLPRAVAPAFDGALVIADAELFFARDTDGDGRADQRRHVDGPFPQAIANPEHAINGLVWGPDNRFWCANHDRAYRFDPERGWLAEPVAWAGQWGLARDDEGRFYHNNNSDPLRWDRVASDYAIRNPDHGAVTGVNESLVDDRRLWPARVTPGVNRGYRAGVLDADFRLARYTGACGPLIYRGDALPWAGDAFVCEPCGNLVKQFRFEGRGAARRARPRWEGSEVLRSTDERFRPVGAANGPDGGLYVVDLYRGVLQHRNFMTSFLRAQVQARGLERPTGLGRIWRLVPEGFERPRPPRLSEASWTELARALEHPSGWWRDTAQRLLVEEGRGEPDALELVRAVLFESARPLGRLHALWTLAGIGALDREAIARGLADPDARVVRATVRASERRLATGDRELVAKLLAVARAGDPATRHQVLLSLGAGRFAAAEAALLELVREDASTSDARSAALSGLFGRELEALQAILEQPGWAEPRPGRDELVRLLARAIAREGVSRRIDALLSELARTEREFAREAALRGLLDGRPVGPTGAPGRLRLARAPAARPWLVERAAASKPARELLASLAWPGRDDLPDEETVRPLDAAERARFERGRRLFADVCAACHLASGRGQPGQTPPLRESPYALGSDARLVRILLNGLQGPIEVGGAWYDGEMPAWGGSDSELAAVLTYVRREWGHGAAPIDAARVRAVREASGPRSGPWTVEALQAAGD